MFGISWIVLVAAFAALVCVVGMVGLVWNSRRGHARVTHNAGSDTNTHPKGEVGRNQPYMPNSPWLLPMIFLIPLFLGTIFAFLLLLWIKNLWVVGGVVSGTVVVLSVLLILLVTTGRGIVRQLNEGQALILFLLGRLYKVQFVFANHVSLNVRWAEEGAKSKERVKEGTNVGEIVDIDKMARQIEGKAPTDESKSRAIEFRSWARSMERKANRYGGLRFIGFPGLHRVVQYGYPQFVYTKFVEDGERKVTVSTKPIVGLVVVPLTVVVKEFELQGMETRPPRFSADDAIIGTSIPINARIKIFIRVVHPFKAVVLTQTEGWSGILEPKLLLPFNNITADTPVDQFVRLQPKVCERLMKELRGEGSKWTYADGDVDKIEIIGVGDVDQPGSNNLVESLRADFGIEVLEVNIMSVDTTVIEHQKLLLATSVARFTGRASVTDAEFRGQANLAEAKLNAQAEAERGKGQADRMRQVLEVAMTNPEYAAVDRYAMAVEATKGTVIMNMGGGNPIGSNTALLREEIKRQGESQEHTPTPVATPDPSLAGSVPEVDKESDDEDDDETGQPEGGTK